MNAKSILLISACLSILPVYAHAQKREYTPGINYTAMPKKVETPKAQEPEIPAAPQAPSTEAAAHPQPPKAPQTNGNTPIEEDNKTRIWNKYKALAGDQATDGTEEKSKNVAAPQGKTTLQKLDGPVQPQTQSPSQSPGGMAAILQSWQENQKQQSEMRSKSFAVPSGNGTMKSTSQAAEDHSVADPQ